MTWKILAKTTRSIITVSEFSRKRLKIHLGIPDHRIHVIPNGVGMPFRQTTLNEEPLQARFNLRKPYFLFVGTQEPRKNLARLFKAREHVQTTLPGFTLAIAGGTGRVFRGTGFQHIPARTQLLGYVSTADLPLLYQAATAVVIPSLYEGFCIPALEAMASGTPLIASNATALPEVTRGAALLVNPLDTEEIACAVQSIVEDESRANDLRARGLQRAAQFSREGCLQDWALSACLITTCRLSLRGGLCLVLQSDHGKHKQDTQIIRQQSRAGEPGPLFESKI